MNIDDIADELGDILTNNGVLFENYYEILGIERTATKDEIKKAYRQKAKENHPDTNPGDPNAADKFIEVADAYEILSDPTRREAYDEEIGVDVDPIEDMVSRLRELMPELRDIPSDDSKIDDLRAWIANDASRAAELIRDLEGKRGTEEPVAPRPSPEPSEEEKYAEYEERAREEFGDFDEDEWLDLGNHPWEPWL
jgi:curved DNA-binding protein CbpA